MQIQQIGSLAFLAAVCPSCSAAWQGRMGASCLMLFLESPEQLLCHAAGVLSLVLTQAAVRQQQQLPMALLVIESASQKV